MTMETAKITSTFGKRIKERRESLKKSQGWLAELMGVSVNAVSKWEKGGNPTLSHMLLLAQHLACSVGYLAGEHEDASIAEVVRLMDELTEEGRSAVLSGVIALHSIQPKRRSNNGKRAA